MTLKMTLVASAAIAALCPLQAQAQTPDATYASASSAPGAVNSEPAAQDIVVTAQFRSQRLQDVPISVSAVQGEALRTSNVRTLEDLTAQVPSFSVAANSNFGSAPLSIRGVGGANGGGNVFADEPVAVYVDGVVVSRLRYSSLDLVDLGGIEVLRGPQGTLYGRNSTAGAVLIKSAAPTRELTGSLDASAGSYDDYRMRGAISGALDEDGKILGRIAVGYSDRGGYARNADGASLGSSRDLLIRARLRLLPTDDTTIDLIGEYIDSKSNPVLLGLSDRSNVRTAANPAGTNVVLPYTLRPDLDAVLDSNRFDLNVPTFTKTIGRSATLDVEQRLGDINLTSITNYRDWDVQGQADSDGSALIPVTPATVTAGSTGNIGDNRGTQFEWQFSHEMRLASTRDNYNWVVGGNYFEEHLGFGPFSIFNRLAGPGGSGTEALFNADQVTQSFAVFGNFTYDFTPQLSLTLGGRYSEESKDFTRNFNVKTILPTTIRPAGFTLLAPPNIDTSAEFSDFSPRVVLTYKPSDAILAYGSFSQGYKSGGFNAFGGSAAFLPEGIDAYEFGLKTQFLDRAVTFNLAAFNYDYSNLQVRTPVPSGGVGIETAQEAKVKGVEFETTLRPISGLTINGNLTYLSAEFAKGVLSAVNVNSYVLGGNPAVGTEDVSGNRLTRAPKWQGAISARYAYDAGDLGTITADLGYRFQSSVFFLETRQDAPTFRAGSWGELDARIALAGRNGWEVALFGKNLTDDRHLSQVQALFALPVAAINEPRRYGVQLHYDF